MDDKTFDLRDALLGRKYPETSSTIWLSEELDYAIAALNRKQANVTDEKELAQIEGELAELGAQKLAQAYRVHVRAISNRSREDILSKALAGKPIKRDMYGREDDLQLMERNRLIAELSFAAHVTKIVSPDGNEQIFTDENRRDLARAILDQAPGSAVATIDALIDGVNQKFAAQEAESTNPDFF